MLSRTKKIVKGIINSYYANEYTYNFEKLYDEFTFNKKLEKLMLIPEDKRKYLLLCRSHRGIGIYTHVLIYLSFLGYCMNRGYCPVIDMQSYPNMYMKDDELNKTNAWELFYKQPMGISVNDAVKYSHKWISPIHLPAKTPFIDSILENGDELRLYQRLYKEFINYNEETKQYVDDELKLIEGKRVIGILCRGTDYTKGKPQGHPIQPSVEEAIEKTQMLINKYNCDYIYLATEESKIERQFRQVFGNKVIVNRRMYYDLDNVDYQNHMLYEVHLNRDNDEYLRGLEYISSINLLSHCTVLFGGGCAGSYAAVIMNDDNYEYWEIYNKGFYE